MNARIGLVLGIVAGFLVLAALGLVTGVVSINSSGGAAMNTMLILTRQYAA